MIIQGKVQELQLSLCYVILYRITIIKLNLEV